MPQDDHSRYPCWDGDGLSRAPPALQVGLGAPLAAREPEHALLLHAEFSILRKARGSLHCLRLNQNHSARRGWELRCRDSLMRAEKVLDVQVVYSAQQTFAKGRDRAVLLGGAGLRPRCPRRVTRAFRPGPRCPLSREETRLDKAPS